VRRPNAARMSRKSLAGAALLLLWACGSVDENAPPAWIDSPPQERAFIYAVGSYVGALYVEDNLSYALDRARGSLSKAIRSHVIADTMVRETETSSRMQSDVKVSTDHHLEKAEHVETWTDRSGERGRPGTVWVLIRVPRP
jgi:hypothetical protein